MKESIQQKQLRCLRAGYFNCKIGDTTDKWQNNWWNGNPFNKPFKEIKFAQKVTYNPWRTAVCQTKGKLFEFWVVYLKCSESSHFDFITIDGKVAYVCHSPMGVPGCDAWKTLIECYFDGYPENEQYPTGGTPHYITKIKSFEYWHTWNLDNSNICDRPQAVIVSDDFNEAEN